VYVLNNKLLVDEVTLLSWFIHGLVRLYENGQRFCLDLNCSRLTESISASSLYRKRVSQLRQLRRDLQ